MEKLWEPTDRQGRITTLRRWFRWLEERGGLEGHPVLAVEAALLAQVIGRSAEAERWADVVDRWQYQDATRPADLQAEAWAAVLRASLCRRGVEQMRADADEAARKFAAANHVRPVATLLQGLACILCGDLDGGDAFLVDAVSVAEEIGGQEILADALCERSLVAVARHQWDRAEILARRARTVLHQAGLEDIYITALICAVQARVALHRGDAQAARQELVSAQRVRPLLTYAVPHLAVQARIELTRVHFALGDLAGARTLMQEIDQLLKRRPGLGTLAGEAEVLRARLAQERGSSVPGSSALTAAELRLLPLLCTHLSFPEISQELFLSPHTVKSEMKSVYRKLGVSSRSQAVTRARELGLLEGDNRSLPPSKG